jgi:hypothetical protein
MIRASRLVQLLPLPLSFLLLAWTPVAQQVTLQVPNCYQFTILTKYIAPALKSNVIVTLTVAHYTVTRFTPNMGAGRNWSADYTIDDAPGNSITVEYDSHVYHLSTPARITLAAGDNPKLYQYNHDQYKTPIVSNVTTLVLIQAVKFCGMRIPPTRI